MSAILSSVRRHRITRVIVSLLMVALIAGLTGCVGEATHAVKYGLTIASGEGGSVSQPGEGTFTVDAGRVVELLAVPTSGYRFDKWTGAVSTIANPNAASTTITMSGNYSVKANFEQTEGTYYTLTTSVSPSGGGSVAPAGGTYAAGSQVTLTATPTSGYNFSNWGGDASGNQNPVTITMSSNKSITAYFQETGVTYYTLTTSVSPSGGGSVSPTGGTYASGSQVTVNATAASGYSFSHWAGDASGSQNPITITMNSNKSITAYFAAENAVVFPDRNLEAVIREAIAKPTGPIYESDLEGLTSLSATYQGITDLTGLEHCINLTWLDLRHNHISDISRLAGLTKLTSLDLSYNEITAVSPLANLIDLWYLYLHNNQISVVSPLANLTNLRYLYIHSNQISDISPLTSLTNLTRLLLFSNQIEDISSLTSLTNLHWLYLNDNRIDDLSHLVGLTKLIRLELSDNDISDISYLAGLARLTSLYLTNNQVRDISPLVANAGLSTGDEVYLNGNPLNEYSVNMCIPELVARGVNVYFDWG